MASLVAVSALEDDAVVVALVHGIWPIPGPHGAVVVVGSPVVELEDSLLVVVTVVHGI